MKWESLTLGELCRKYNGKIQTGPFGSQLHQSDYKKHGTPVVMPKDIVNDQISLESIARIEEKDVERLSKHTLKKGDIVFPRRGEISKRALVREENEGFICGTGCLKISINSEHVSNLYLNYYLARKESVDWLENNAVGSTMKNISGEILSNVPIELPPLSTQQKIAAILSAYDDLIENNLRRIRLLEEAAQHLYREWFVRFRFPGWEEVKVVNGLPEGWEKGKVEDLFILQRGFDLPSHERENGEYPIIASTGTVGYHSNFKVEPPGVVTGRSGTIGKVSFVDKPFWPLNTSLWVKKYFKCGPHFVYFFLKSFGLESFGGGVAVPSLDRNVIHSQSCVIPSDGILRKFEEIIYPFFLKISNLEKQNQKLKEAREILLPRLMNQTIEV